MTDAKNISFDFEDDKRSFHGEGRTITVEFSHFYLVACYVPNSGKLSCLLPEMYAYFLRGAFSLYLRDRCGTNFDSFPLLVFLVCNQLF